MQLCANSLFYKLRITAHNCAWLRKAIYPVRIWARMYARIYAPKWVLLGGRYCTWWPLDSITHGTGWPHAIAINHCNLLLIVKHNKFTVQSLCIDISELQTSTLIHTENVQYFPPCAPLPKCTVFECQNITISHDFLTLVRSHNQSFPPTNVWKLATFSSFLRLSTNPVKSIFFDKFHLSCCQCKFRLHTTAFLWG